ncbi:MAG TPA: hypothetical protein VHU86_04505 [Solirubrobacterales bacterium]|nr:hypothetical protein [Solirubrobacterales bacterium]
MNNLTRFLSQIAAGLDRQADALSGGDPAGETPPSLALRDYASQLRAVADNTHDGATDWARLDGEIGIDLDPQPEPLIRILFDPEDVEAMAAEAGLPISVAIIRAWTWARAIEETATELCFSQLLSVLITGRP